MKPVAGIILAAGSASRMGRDKRLMVVDGRSMLDHAIAAAQGAGLEPILVVRGHQPLGLDHVTEIENPAPERGMGSSLALGVAALPARTEAVVVLLADMPAVKASHVNQLVDAFAPARNHHIVVPVCGGKRGNPVLLGRCFFADLAALSGDKGARALIESHPDRVVRLEMDAAVLHDVDTEADLARWEQSP